MELPVDTYTPILKWKRGEHRALSNLSSEVCHHVYPCIEIRSDTEHAHLISSFHDVWPGPAMVDYSAPNGLMSGWRLNGLKDALDKVLAGDLRAIPVINPHDTNLIGNGALVQRIKQCPRCAVRIRVTSTQGVTALPASCQVVLNTLSGSPILKDLVVDLRAISGQIDQQSIVFLVTALNQVSVMGFAKIILVSGAFPEQLAQGYARAQRYDYSTWDEVRQQTSVGNLGYGDYTILHPHWEEVTGMRKGKCTIRYTLDNEWLILKGATGTKDESINLSEILLSVYGNDFKGAPFSFGDQIIANRADPLMDLSDKKGGAEYHISEGVNHHITHVVTDDLDLLL
jgi:hypothetical protein